MNSWLTVARKIVLDQVAYDNKARGVKSAKIQTFCQCNAGTIDDTPVKNTNRTGCNIIEIISELKFPQVQGSLQLARKIALDPVAYKNEVRGLKSVKMQTFSRCNEGTIVDGSVKNPNCTGCNVIESTEIFASS